MRKNLFFNIASIGTNYLFPLILVPVAVNSFGIDGFGAAALVFSFIGIQITIINFNLENISPLFDKVLSDSEIYYNVMVIRLFLFCVTYALFGGGIFLFFPEQIIFFLVSSLSTIGAVFNLNYILIKNESYRLIFSSNLISKSISYLLAFFSCVYFENIIAYVFFVNSWMMIQWIINLRSANLKFSRGLIRRESILSIVRFGYLSFLNSLLSLILVYSVQPLVTYFSGFYVGGMFAIYEKIIRAVNGIYNAVLNVMLSNGERRGLPINHYLNAGMIISYTLSIVGMFFLCVFTIFIISSFKSVSVNNYYLLLSFFIIGVISIGNYSSVLILTRLRQFAELNKILLVSAFLCLILVSFLPYHLGLLGGLLTLFLSEGLSCLLKWKLSIKIIE